jgi:hypothetical protein
MVRPNEPMSSTADSTMRWYMVCTLGVWPTSAHAWCVPALSPIRCCTTYRWALSRAAAYGQQTHVGVGLGLSSPGLGLQGLGSLLQE